MNWTAARYIADSKAVKSSYAWLFIVPLTAKAFEKLAPTITINLFGQPFQIVMALPFSWEILFYAAVLFSLGNIIYAIRCPKIIRLYKNFSEFRENGNTLLMVHKAMRQMVEESKNKLKDKYKERAIRYIDKYANGNMHHTYEPSGIDYYVFDEAFYDTNNADKQDVPPEAFQTAQEIAENYNPFSMVITLILYFFGLAMMLIIAVQNIVFVIRHSSIISC